MNLSAPQRAAACLVEFHSRMTPSSFRCGARLQACRVDIRVDVRPQGAI